MCEQNVKEFWDFTKRKLHVVGIHEEKFHVKFLENIFNQTIEENFQNLEKGKLIHITETHWRQKRSFPYFITVKTSN